MKRVLVAYPHGEQFPVLLVDEISMVSQPRRGSFGAQAMRIYGSLPSYLGLAELKKLLLDLPVPFVAAVCEGETESPRRVAFRAKVQEHLPSAGESFLVESATGITLELFVEGEQPRLGPETEEHP